MSLTIYCKKSLRIYLEIRTPFLNVKWGGIARRLQIRICVFKQSIRFCYGVDPKPREAYFLILVFILKKCSKNNYSHEVLAQDGRNLRKKQMISQDLRHPKHKKKSHNSFCATCHYLGPKNCWERSTEMLGYWNKNKNSRALFVSGLKSKPKFDHKMGMVSSE